MFFINSNSDYNFFWTVSFQTVIELSALKQATISISKLYARNKNSGILLDGLVPFVQANAHGAAFKYLIFYQQFRIVQPSDWYCGFFGLRSFLPILQKE